jgi:nitroreductase
MTIGSKIMRKIYLFALLFAGFASLMGGGPFAPEAADNDNPAWANMVNSYSPRNFASGAVNRADLDKILEAGNRSPSAGNRQPWHFTVVQTQDLARRIVPNIVEGNILIIVSASGDGQTNGAAILDCGLAVENMYLAAQALGLGSRIYTGPMGTVNGQLKSELGLPRGYSAVALIRVGRVPAGADGVSGASARKDLNSMVNYK